MRQIILDTETTGLEHTEGHRIIEIGCVELIDRRLTGNHYHVYINPERDVDQGALKVHGISNEFLIDKPIFSEVLNEFLDFIGNSQLVIHNATFDMGFLNHELRLAKSRAYPLENLCPVLDTLLLAREKHPRQKNNLDALCKRYDIDNSKRDLHGALLDAEILALVYLAMTGGQEDMFRIDDKDPHPSSSAAHAIQHIDHEKSVVNNTTILMPSESELNNHQAFIEMIVEKSGKKSLWKDD